MADKKISQLTAASTPLTGTEELAIVQSGSTVKATAQDVADLAGAPYLVYTAKVSQSGTSAPTTVEMQNTLGAFTITRTATGTYNFSCAAFTGFSVFGKVAVFLTNSKANPSVGISAQYVPPLSAVQIITIDNVNADDVLSNATLEIRLYP